MHPNYYIQQFHGEIPEKLHKHLVSFCKTEPTTIFPFSYNGTLEVFLEKWNRPVMVFPKNEKEYGVIYITHHDHFGQR